MSEIISPGRNDGIIDVFRKSTQRLNSWMQAVSQGAQTLEGSGSPEGVIEGRVGMDYLDTAAGKFYKKSTNGGTADWKILN